MSKRSSPQEQTGSSGVSRVMADFSDLTWGPVENVRHDLGIDLFLQVRDERRFDRTALVTAQVKAGDSYFELEEDLEGGELVGWWYTEPDAEHFEDWVQIGLPHLLVVHDPKTRVSHWVHVTKEAVISTGKGYKILVPVAQRVDEANRDALEAVAASGKNASILQGTAFTASSKAVAPGRALRHALIVPRLIAPHPNMGRSRELEPEEAIALITLGRWSDIELYLADEKNPKMESASPTSRDWRWRFYHAYRQWVFADDRQPLVNLAEAATSSKVRRVDGYRIAACVNAAAVALYDAELWDEAESILLRAGDDLPPIDHAWVLIHRAVVKSETGDVESARALAANAQRTVRLDADDVTANAIGSAATSLLYETVAWGSEDLGEMITASDTAASWWRSQSISWAMTEHDDQIFRAWSESDDVGGRSVRVAQYRLFGAFLSASFAGARRSAAHPLAIYAHHELMHQEMAWRSAQAAQSERDTQQDDRGALSVDSCRSLASALDQLRRYGCEDDLERAVRRLWAAGPVIPVREALHRAVESLWTPTNARAKLALFERAGDLLPGSKADETARYLLELLVDPVPFAGRIRPSFSVSHFANKSLRGVLPAAGDATHKLVADYLMNAIPDDHDPRADNWGRLLHSVRSRSLAKGAESFLNAAMSGAGPRLSAVILGKLLEAGVSGAESELMLRADRGDRYAVAELGSATALSSVAAVVRVERDADACSEIVREARRGRHGFSNWWDSAHALVVLNLAFPDLAQWDQVLELLFDPFVAQDQKIDTMRVLAERADEVPDTVASALRESWAHGSSGLPAYSNIFSSSQEDLVEANLALGLGLGALDPETAIARIFAWLRGSASQRKAAGGLLRTLGRRAQNPLIQGALVMLTGDPQYRVRAAAAAALTRGISEPISEVVETAIFVSAREAGCAVPLAIARALSDASDAWLRREELQDELQVHLSALVRQAGRSDRL